MTQKDLAVECLQVLDVYKPYIKKFSSEESMPCFFEGFAGFWVDQEPELWNKVKEVEATCGRIVYAITHEFTEFGELWSMLMSPKDDEVLADVLFAADATNRRFYAFSYVWNKTDDQCSEFGDIAVQAAFGGIKRIH